MTKAVGNESTIHGSVVDAIGRWILGGVYAPGDSTIGPLRSGAQHHELGVSELDGHR